VGARRCRATCAHHRARRARKDGGGGGEENNNNDDKPLNFSMGRYGGRATTTNESLHNQSLILCINIVILINIISIIVGEGACVSV